MTTTSSRFGALKAVVLWPARAIIVVYLLLDAIVFPLFRPLVRWINGLQIVQTLQRLIARLPPYVILVLLALPFVLAEPAKIYGLYLLGSGMIVRGVVVLALAYFVSIVVVERIFDAGHAKLMRIQWFARLWFWFTAIRQRVMDWVQSTRMWRRLDVLRERLRRRLHAMREGSSGAKRPATPPPLRPDPRRL